MEKKPEMTIRVYLPADQRAVIDLWDTCGLIVPSNNPLEDIKRKMAEDPGQFFVGEINGEIVSSCMAGYDGHRGWIYYLAVKPGLQRLGLASQMMMYAEERLLELGCPKIDLMVRESNKEVITFYHRIGYNDDPVIVLSKRLYEDGPFTTT